MAHVNQHRKKLLARVRRIGGQIAALERSLGGETDCTEVLVQVAAARGAVHGLMMELLGEHLQEHVVTENDGKKRAREAERLIDLLRGYGK